MGKATAPEPRKGPPPPADMAEGYEAMAMELLASAQAEGEVGEALAADCQHHSVEASAKLGKAQRLREEAVVSAQIATSLRLRVLDEPKVELAGPERPYQPGQDPL